MKISLAQAGAELGPLAFIGARRPAHRCEFLAGLDARHDLVEKIGRRPDVVCVHHERRERLRGEKGASSAPLIPRDSALSPQTG